MKFSLNGVSDFSGVFVLYRTVFISNERELVTWQQMIKKSWESYSTKKSKTYWDYNIFKCQFQGQEWAFMELLLKCF